MHTHAHTTFTHTEREERHKHICYTDSVDRKRAVKIDVALQVDKFFKKTLYQLVHNTSQNNVRDNFVNSRKMTMIFVTMV